MVEGVIPLFFPRSRAEVTERLRHMLSRRPSCVLEDDDTSRWTLQTILGQMKGEFKLESISGVFRLLKRMGLSYLRARSYVHSPDQDYHEKLAYILECVKRCKESNGTQVLLFLDEFTYYNHASLAKAWAPKTQQPLARRAIGKTRQWRIVAAMDCFSAEVVALQRYKITVPTFIELLKLLPQRFPLAQTIYLVIDNWPVHFHPDVLFALEKQNSPFEFNQPLSWQTINPKKKYRDLNLPIQFLPLPTYASWLNPIEKLWKFLQQRVIHLHDKTNDFTDLKIVLQKSLDELAKPSNELLKYVGLANPNNIYGTIN